MPKRLIFIFLPALLVLGLSLLIVLSYSPLRDITTPPKPDRSGAGVLESYDSVINLPIQINFSDLQDYANRELPKVLVNKRERKRYKTRLLGLPVEVKGRLSTYVERRGQIRVSHHKDHLQLWLPLYFKASFKGSDALDPDASTKGKVNVRMRLALSMTPQWQPVLEVRSSYRWVKKPRLKIGLLRLDASEAIGEALQKRLHKLGQELETRLRESSTLRQRAEQRWYEFHQVRQLGESDIPSWLMVDPQAAYFTPPRFTDTAMLLEFALSARLTTLLGPVQAPPRPEPLPDLHIGEPPASGFRLQLPVILEFAGILDSLKQRYLGQTLNLPEGELRIRDLKLYASAEQLVVGAQVDARSSHSLFNTHGWLYLSGRPVYDAQTQQLRVDDFAFTRQVNNPLVSSASWLLQDSLRARFAEALTLDLADRITATKDSMTQRLNRPLDDGFVMSGELQSLEVGGIQLQSDQLVLIIKADGVVAISTGVSLPPATANNPAAAPPVP